MKKGIIFFTVIISCLAISCNKVNSPLEDDKKLSEQTNTEKIFNELNAHLIQQPHQEFNYPQTRGKWNWTTVLAVAVSDAYGAWHGAATGGKILAFIGASTRGVGAICATCLFGAVVGAVASSEAAELTSSSYRPPEYSVTASTAINTFSTSVKNEAICYTTELEFPQKYNDIAISGGIHNSVLKSISDENATTAISPMNLTDNSATPTGPDGEDGNGGTSISFPEETAALPLATTTANLQTAIPEINTSEYIQAESILTNRKEFAEEIDKNVEEMKQAYDENGTLDIQKLFSITSPVDENEKIILIYYLEVCNSYSQNIKDLIVISNEYIKKIDELSYLDERTKRNLFLYISVIANSANYWSAVDL